MSDLSSLLKSDMSLFISFVLSHPLHFTFLILFSSYLHTVLSFLLPLFFTTSLLLLAAVTFIPKLSPEDTDLEPSSLSALVQALRAKIDSQREENLRLEDFEVFRAVFEHPTMTNLEHSDPESELESEPTAFLDAADSAFSKPDEELRVDDSFDSCSVQEDERIGSLWEEFDDSEKGKVEKTTLAPFCTGPEKVVLEGNGSGSEATGCNDLVGGKENGNSSHGSTPSSVDTWSLSQNSHCASVSFDRDSSLPSPVGSEYSFGSYGSMRKEKEWKRTVACKLFEERNNGGAGPGEGEGMDMLWETAYEMESRKRNKNVKKAKKDKKKYEIEEEEEEDDDDEREPNAQLCHLQALNFLTRKMSLGMKRNKNVKKAKKDKKKYEIEEEEEDDDDEREPNAQLCYLQALNFLTSKMSLGLKRNKNVKKAKKDKKKYEIEEEEDDDDDEREPNAQLCYLQALNFSTRKMSLGMGKPNLMKISKAIKGIGWLHGLKRHSKKVHNGDGDK